MLYFGDDLAKIGPMKKPPQQTSNNGWTGGQYSLLRVLFGLFLLTFFIVRLRSFLLNQGEPTIPSTWIALEQLLLWIGLEQRFLFFVPCIAIVASIALMLGVFDRGAAWLLFFAVPLRWESPVLVQLIAASNALLLLHIFVPSAPYGSLPARNRVDPVGSWFMPALLPKLAWLYLGATYFSSGLNNLVAPPDFLPGAVGYALAACQLLFALLAFSHKTRPWAWSALFLVNGVLIATGTSLFTVEVLLIHLFAFSPAWFPPRNTANLLFYDGSCGLCHRAVRFILAEDLRATLFRFAPLGGDTFLVKITEQQRTHLPDSLVLLTGDGRLLFKSAAALTVADQLGGAWRVLARLARLVPRPISDAVYDGIARIRHVLFSRPSDVCPILPPHQRARFES